jgi:hypothetical protein
MNPPTPAPTDADYSMGSEILRREGQEVAPTSTPEVEFALVLSRMIDSVSQDPQHLRQTVYELARRKLQEQFTGESAAEMRSVGNALETAIQGVEAFSRREDPSLRALRAPEPAQEPHAFVDPPRVDAPREEVVARWVPPVLEASVQYPGWSIKDRFKGPRKAPGLTLAWTFSWRLASLLAIPIAIAIAVAVQQRGLLFTSPRTNADLVKAAPAVSRPAAATANAAKAAAPSPLIPTSYGIHAVSGDRLYELEALPGRAPDIRVAISPAITTPSRTTLPDGHLRFIVFRRDSTTSAADRAEVRLIAKIARAIGFDGAGKPVDSKLDDTWVIRNISIPYRTAPSKDNPDMYEIQSENPDAALSPGRYALIVKGQSYDFSIAGTVTDPRHCLERLAATNGQFYSECKKP